MGVKSITTLDRIRANINNEQRSVVVDSWSSNDDQISVYWSPITLADKQKIQRHAKGDDQLTTVYTLIFKATDKDGNLLFDLGDKRALMSEISCKEIERIALEMLGIYDEVITPEK